MGSLYRHDPYNKDCLAHIHRQSQPHVEAPPTVHQPDTPAVVILHQALVDRVTFVPYPDAPIAMPDDSEMDKAQLTRLFIGQLPYHVTDMQLQWLCDLFAEQREVYHTERIIKWNEFHQPKGCVHTYCMQEDAEPIMLALSKKVLFDDGGVWYARTPAEAVELRQYCDAMKQDKSMRFRERPYQPVVVQLAHSTFVPRSATPPPQPQQQSTTTTAATLVTPPPYQQPPTYTGVVADVPLY